MSLHGMIAHFLLALSNILLSICTKVHIFIDTVVVTKGILIQRKDAYFTNRKV